MNDPIAAHSERSQLLALDFHQVDMGLRERSEGAAMLL